MSTTLLSKSEVIELRKQIGANVARLRRGQNPTWTQFDLAVESGVRPETISRIERGSTDFQISHILRIAAALDVEPGELLSGS